MQVDKVLFELTIYSCSQQSFAVWWQEEENKTIAQAKEKGCSEEIIQQFLSKHSPKKVWKYNQIIGYILVRITAYDVIFELYRTLDLRFFKRLSKKHFIQNMHLMGYHFRADGKTDDAIKKDILRMIQSIQREQLRKDFFVDCTTMNNLIPYISICEMMGDLRSCDDGQKCD